jgi:RNA polymerase sigma-70 factor (ECF subfamily)
MPLTLALEVIEQAQAGDKDAVAMLYETFQPQVYCYLYYRTGDYHSAQDLTADVFVKLLRSLPSYQQRKNGSFRAWLFEIARNVTIDHFRRMTLRQHTDLHEEVLDHRPTPEMIAERRLSNESLRRALRRLTHDQCDVIALRFLADMPIAEVAQVLNKSESAIKNLQLRGLAALQQILTAQKITYG